jgi:hypothetical protein
VIDIYTVGQYKEVYNQNKIQRWEASFKLEVRPAEALPLQHQPATVDGCQSNNELREAP